MSTAAPSRETTSSEATSSQRGSSPLSPPSRRPRSGKRGWWVPWAFLAPAVVFELLVHIIPMLTGIWISFVGLTKFFLANWGAAPWVGLGNYQIVADFNGAVGAGLLQSFLITCGFTVLVVAFSWVLGMGGAIALQDRFRGQGFFRTLFLIPYALPVYAGIIAWKFMFQQDTGAVNHVLVDQLHLMDAKPFWLIGDNSFWAMVIVAIWRLWPFAFLMLMAGLQSIPAEVYEASAVDGAKWFRQWRSITLPMLKPVNNVLLLVIFLWTFNDFNTPFVLFGATQPPAGDLVSFHIYNSAFLNWNFGSGAAMSVLLLLFLLIVTGVYLLVTNRKGQRDA